MCVSVEEWQGRKGVLYENVEEGVGTQVLVWIGEQVKISSSSLILLFSEDLFP